MAEVVSYLVPRVQELLGTPSDDAGHRLFAMVPETPGAEERLRSLLDEDRPVMATAAGLVTTAADGTASSVVIGAGAVDGLSNDVGSSLQLTFRPDENSGDTNPTGVIEADFLIAWPQQSGSEPPPPPAVRFLFDVTPTRIVPLPPPPPPEGEPDGFLDGLKCVLSTAANAFLPALASSLPALSAGPEAFLGLAAANAGVALPGAILNGVGCFTGSSDAAVPIVPWTLLEYPKEIVEGVIDRGKPVLDRLLGTVPLTVLASSTPRLVCGVDNGCFVFQGAVGTGENGVGQAAGALVGDMAMMPADVDLVVVVQEDAIKALVTYNEPASLQTIEFEYDRPDGTPRKPRVTGSRSAAGFDLACVVSGLSAPMLMLVQSALPKLSNGVDAFLLAMLDGAGEALGTGVTNLVRYCIGGKQQQQQQQQQFTTNAKGGIQ